MTGKQLQDLLDILRENQVAVYKTPQLELVLHERTPDYREPRDMTPEGLADQMAHEDRGVAVFNGPDTENPMLYGEDPTNFGAVPYFAGDKANKE